MRHARFRQAVPFSQKRFRLNARVSFWRRIHNPASATKTINRRSLQIWTRVRRFLRILPSKRLGAYKSCQRCRHKCETFWLRVQLPLTQSRFLSVYRWRLGLHLACSGCKSCARVTELRMWTDFLLWHLIWLKWHLRATAAGKYEDRQRCRRR